MDRKHVICIGAQRTSTTKLYECLRKHPDIFVPDEKELHYFNSVLPPHKDGISLIEPVFITKFIIRHLLTATDYYSKNVHSARGIRKMLLRGRSVPGYYWSKFKNNNLVSCDITPAYSLLNEKGVALMKKTAPNSKIIFILRDPIERLWSEVNYHHNKTRVNLEERLSDPVFINNLMNGRHQQKRSDYASVYELYSKYFSDILILVFEEMNESINESMETILKFIGVSSNEDVLANMPLEIKINASNKISMPKEIEQKLLEAHSENYKRNIEYFGTQLSKWKYYKYFN